MRSRIRKGNLRLRSAFCSDVETVRLAGCVFKRAFCVERQSVALDRLSAEQPAEISLRKDFRDDVPVDVSDQCAGNLRRRDGSDRHRIAVRLDELRRGDAEPRAVRLGHVFNKMFAQRAGSLDFAHCVVLLFVCGADHAEQG